MPANGNELLGAANTKGTKNKKEKKTNEINESRGEMKEQTNQCITHTSHRGRGIPPLSTDRGNKEPRRRGERERGRYTYRGEKKKKSNDP